MSQTIFARGQITILDLNDSPNPNLLDHTDVDSFGVGYWASGQSQLSISEEKYNNKSIISVLLGAGLDTRTCVTNYTQPVHLMYNSLYTLSALVKCSHSNAKLNIKVSCSTAPTSGDGHYTIISRDDYSVADEWKRINLTFRVGSRSGDDPDADYTLSFLSISSTGTASTTPDGIELLFLEPKLELGDKVTAWCPSESDRQGVSGFTIIPTPSTLTFSTNDHGVVVEDVSRKTTTIKVFRGSEDVSAEAEFGAPVNASGCSAAKIIGKNNVYSLTSISTNTYNPSSGKVTLSVPTGYFDVPVTIDGNIISVRITFIVNVNAYLAEQEMTVKEFRSTYEQFVGNETSLEHYKSGILQTAQNISLTVKKEVDEDTHNYITGTDMHRVRSDYFRLSNDARICTANTTGSTLSIECKSTGSASGITFGNGVNRYNIKVIPERDYTLSCWVQCDSQCGETEDDNGFVFDIFKCSGIVGLAGNLLFSKRNVISVVGSWQFVEYQFRTPVDCDYISIAVNFISAGATTINGHISSIILEEGSYSKWDHSRLDTYYTGGNLLPGTKDMTANVVNPSYLTDEYYNGCRVISRTNTSTSSKGALYRFSGDVSAKDCYVLSFWVKGAGSVYTSVSLDGSGNQLVLESSNHTTDLGERNTALTLPVTTSWRRVWFYLYVPYGRSGTATFNIQADTSSSISVCGVKFETGAFPTEYTDNAVSKEYPYGLEGDLLATGINIKDREITLTADKTLIRDNEGKTIAMFSDGKMSAELIDVSKLLAGEIEAHKAVLKNVNIGEDAYVQSALHMGNTFTYRQVHTIPETFLNNIDDYKISTLRTKYGTSQWNQALHVNGSGTEIFIYAGSYLFEGTFDIDAYPKFVYDDVTSSAGYWYVKQLKGQTGVEMGFQIPEEFRMPYIRSYNESLVSQLGDQGLEIASTYDKDYVASSLRLHDKPTVTVTNNSITISGARTSTGGNRSTFSIYVDETDSKLYLKYQNYGSRYQTPSIMDFETLWTKLLAL